MIGEEQEFKYHPNQFFFRTHNFIPIMNEKWNRKLNLDARSNIPHWNNLHSIFMLPFNPSIQSSFLFSFNHNYFDTIVTYINVNKEIFSNNFFNSFVNRKDANLTNVDNQDLKISKEINESKTSNFGGNGDRRKSFISNMASNTFIRNAIAGTIAGMMCQAIMHPLDSLKTRLQASQRGQKMTHLSINFFVKEAYRILSTEGIGSFYAGVQPAVLASGLSWGLYFALYNKSKELLGVKIHSSNMSGAEEAFRLVLSGAIAGTFTSSLTHPIWLIKTLMQLQKRDNFPIEKRYKSMSDAFKSIITNDGVKGLFVGITPTLALVSHGIIHFVCYDLLKKYYLKLFQNNEKFLSHEAFFCGGLTKMIAVLSTYPLQVVKTRLQDYENKSHKVQYRGMIHCLQRMYIEEGFWSYYRGIWPVLIRLAPQGAVTFMIYEKVQEILISFSK